MLNWLFSFRSAKAIAQSLEQQKKEKLATALFRTVESPDEVRVLSVCLLHDFNLGFSLLDRRKSQSLPRELQKQTPLPLPLLPLLPLLLQHQLNPPPRQFYH